jgi:hypothetical protein
MESLLAKIEERREKKAQLARAEADKRRANANKIEREVYDLLKTTVGEMNRQSQEISPATHDVKAVATVLLDDLNREISAWSQRRRALILADRKLKHPILNTPWIWQMQKYLGEIMTIHLPNTIETGQTYLWRFFISAIYARSPNLAYETFRSRPLPRNRGSMRSQVTTNTSSALAPSDDATTHTSANHPTLNFGSDWERQDSDADTLHERTLSPGV